MESLELPFDLIWEGKIEPLSPNQLELSNSENIMIFDSDFPADFNFHDSGLIFDGKKSPAQLLTELQQDIEDSEVDEDSNQWLDQTITLPLVPDYINPPLQRHSLKIEQTAQLLQEFDSVFDAVELTQNSLTHLTPPQTPPDSPQAENLNDLKLDQFIFSSIPQHQQQQHPSIIQSNYLYFDQNESIQSPVCSQDIAHEMEAVEELVRSRAENLPDWTTDDDDNSSESYSPNSSPRSEDSFETAAQSCSNDDEWSPKSSPSQVKKRTRPYGRSSEDKKFRKKEQNKNAATRYRQKKKAEVEVFLGEERELQDINDKLHVKCADIKREINVLKSLMCELYRSKGLL